VILEPTHQKAERIHDIRRDRIVGKEPLLTNAAYHGTQSTSQSSQGAEYAQY